ncbi:MAG: hypothetical protein RL619_1902, partial [Bacteroidota bacterium]
MAYFINVFMKMFYVSASFSPKSVNFLFYLSYDVKNTIIMKKSTILEFFDVLTGNIISCFITKNIVSELNFVKFNERSSIDCLSKLRQNRWQRWLFLPFILTIILMTAYTVNAQNIQGIIPVQHPIGGSGVDGDAWAHEPIGTKYENIGDLFDKLYNGTTHATNHGVLNLTNGQLIYPGETFFLQDRY